MKQEFIDGPALEFDLRNPDHACFLFGESGAELCKRANENPVYATATIEIVDAQNSTIWLATPKES